MNGNSAPLFLMVLGASMLCASGAWAQPPEPPSKAAQDAAQADSKAWKDLRRKNGERERKDPKAAIAAYQEFFEARPALSRSLGVQVSLSIAKVWREDAHNPTKALEVLDGALEKYAKTSSLTELQVQRLHTLLALGRAKDVIASMEEGWPRQLEGEEGEVSAWLRPFMAALRGEGQRARQAEVLAQAMKRMPAFLDATRQGGGRGWMWSELVGALLAQKRDDEALSWAKLRWVQSDFSAREIEEASLMVAKVWLARGEDGQKALRAFARAQRDEAAPNPLAGVALPLFSTEDVTAARAQLEAQSSPTKRARDSISLFLALGKTREALGEARRMLIEAPSSSQGPSEVCRAFKALDNNPRRANAFLLFLQTRQGQNPLDAALTELAPVAVTPAAAVPVPVGEVNATKEEVPAMEGAPVAAPGKGAKASKAVKAVGLPSPVEPWAVEAPVAAMLLLSGRATPRELWRSGELSAPVVRVLLDNPLDERDLVPDTPQVRPLLRALSLLWQAQNNGQRLSRSAQRRLEALQKEAAPVVPAPGAAAPVPDTERVADEEGAPDEKGDAQETTAEDGEGAMVALPRAQDVLDVRLVNTRKAVSPELVRLMSAKAAISRGETLELLWQNGALDANDAQEWLDMGPPVGSENRALTKTAIELLVAHAPDRLEGAPRAKRVGPRGLAWAGDYLRLKNDARAPQMLRRALDEMKAPEKKEYGKNGLGLIIAHHGLVWWHRDRGEYEKAAQIMLDAPKYYGMPSMLADAKMEAGRLYLQAGKPEEAKKQWALVPDNSGWYKGLALHDEIQFLVRQGKLVEARALVKQTVTGSRSEAIQAVLLSASGQLYYLAGDWAKAKAESQAAIAQFQKLKRGQSGEGVDAVINTAQARLNWSEQWLKAPMGIEPQSLRLTWQRGQTEKAPRTLSLSVRSPRALKIQAAASSPAVTAKVEEKRSSNEYFWQQDITVEIQPEKLGQGAAVKITSPDLPDFVANIPIEVSVQKALTLSPSTVFFGEIEAGKAASVTLKLSAPMPFRVLEVKPENASLQVQGDLARTETSHTLRLTFTPLQVGQFYSGTLRIKTDVPGEEVVEVPYVAHVP